MRTRATTLACVLMLSLVMALVPGVRAEDPPEAMFEQTPPRLSLSDGHVSFWRPGAQDWARAQINTPLAPGDVLATGSPGTLEVQTGARAFVRAWANTQLTLANQEPDFIQFRVTAGSAVFDLRTLEPGHTVEVGTPNAAVTIEQAGYYRVDVTGERSRIMTRRGGRATVTPANGQSVVVTPSEEVVIDGIANTQLAAYAAPPLDEWDRWNYTRTDRVLDAVSARYVPPGTYGLSDLDPYGTWRVVSTYGTVWVPTGMPAGWTPYSAGSWIIDPVYGWTWVDTAPWGWAPYHHGRWCFVDGYWAWAPGPVIARPVYAPALVAFLGEPTGGVIVGPGGPVVGWVALGWGEPVLPWWGRRGVIHEPSWRGWGGPRVVNNVIVNNTTVVNVQNITVYRNASVPHAIVAVDRTRFGHGPITTTRVARVDEQRLRPLHEAPQISPTPASFVPTTTRGFRPPENSLNRPVVATRPAHRGPEPTGGSAQTGTPPVVSVPPQRLVTVAKPPEQEPGGVTPRPAFGHGTSDRPMTDRKPPPGPPRFGATPAGPPTPGHAGAPTSAQPAKPRPTLQQGENPAGTSKGPIGPAPTNHNGGPPSAVRRAGAQPELGKGPGGPPPTARQAETPPAAGRRPVGPPIVSHTDGPPVANRQIETSSARAGKGPDGPPRPRTATPPPTARPAEQILKTGAAQPATIGRGPGAPSPAAQRPAPPRQPAPPLPGEPANRLAPDRAQAGPPQAGPPKG